MTRDRITRRETLQGIVAAVTVLGVGPAGASGDGTDRYVVGTAGRSASDITEHEASRLERRIEFGSIGGATVGRFTAEAADRLERREDVRYVERNHTREVLGRAVSDAPEDPTDEQVTPWGVERIGAEALHGLGETGNRASIAILDSGIDAEHESLDATDGFALAECRGGGCTAEWDDDRGHGTHCAGSASAVDNDVGVVGACPDAALYSVKVLADDGSGTDADIAEGIRWCVDNGIDVINMSLGGPSDGGVLHDAVRYAYEEGVLVVAAAGNAGPDEGTVDYPAAYDECIAVGATDPDDDVPRWSSRGEEVELVAPGANVLSTYPGDDYAVLEGTSMSAPLVAGIAAILLATGTPHAENLDDVGDPGGVRGILRQTAEDLGFEGTAQGYGLLDAREAYRRVGLAVSTPEPSEIRTTAATVDAALVSSGDADSAEVYVRWRRPETDGWTASPPQSLPPDEELSVEVTGLRADTEYELQAVARTDDDREESELVSFETGLDSVVVETGEATEVDDVSATLTGDLAGIGDADAVEVSCLVWPADDPDERIRTETKTITGIGGFELDVSDLEPETEYEARAVAETDDTTSEGEEVAFGTEPELGLPEIDAFDVRDTSTTRVVRGSVDWEVSHPEAVLETVTSELRYADERELIHAVTTELDEDTESGTHPLTNWDRVEGAGDEYDVTLVVADGAGETTEETKRVTLDERSAAPSVDRFELTADEFVGNPRVVVDWAVSDEGEELADLELELLDGEGEVVDATSAMVRGGERDGTARLTDRSRDGGEYEVRLVVTDLLEQGTEVTEGITLGESANRARPPVPDRLRP